MSKFAPVYLFTGPERGEKDRTISEIIKRYTSETGLEPEIYKFYPFEISLSEVIALLKNGGLFSEYKFVFLMNTDELKKNEIPLLVSYLKNPGKDSTLFLLSDSIQIDRKISSAVKKENIRIFWELFQNQKINWIQSYFRKNSMQISDDAVDMILEMVENRTDDLEAVCSRLSAYFKESGTISEEEVEEYVYHSKEENVFTLFGRLIRNDFAGSIEILHNIRLSGEHNPVQLFGGLLWQYRNLLKLKRLKMEGVPDQDALQKAKIRGKKNQSLYLNAIKLHPVGELERIISLIARCDRNAREINKERWILLMEMFIYYTICRKGELPEPYRN